MDYKAIRERINSSVSMKQVAELFGVEINRQDFGKCPFHAGDRTASMKVYNDGKGWYCFGCKSGGDAIDFVEKIANKNFVGSCKYLNDMFGLGIDFAREHEKTNTDEYKILLAMRNKNERIDRFRYICVLRRLEEAESKWKCMDIAKRECAVESLEYANAMAHIDEAKYECDLLEMEARKREVRL